MKHIFCFYILMLLLPASFNLASGQTKSGGHVFCSDKKWNPVKYRETDGKIYPIDDGSKNEYVIIKCDGTYESAEDEGTVVLRGKWSWNQTKKEISMTCDKKIKEFPLSTTTKVVKWTSGELVISKKDGGGKELLFYFELSK